MAAAEVGATERHALLCWVVDGDVGPTTFAGAGCEEDDVRGKCGAGIWNANGLESDLAQGEVRPTRGRFWWCPPVHVWLAGHLTNPEKFVVAAQIGADNNLHLHDLLGVEGNDVCMKKGVFGAIARLPSKSQKISRNLLPFSP